jgi:dipeptidase E
MYLSSWRLGDQSERLLALMGGTGLVAVIGNAMDAASDIVRREAVEYEIAALSGIGLETVEVDLRDYFDNSAGLADTLTRFDVLWVRGGNTFMLRLALARSGADAAITELLQRDALVYAGYSAGCCVLAPSLRGLELVDYPDAVEATYGVPAIWEGLGLLEYAFVPHYRSVHPESEAMELVVARYQREGVPHRVLRDGQVIVIDT